MALDEAGAYGEHGGRISAEIGDHCVSTERKEPSTSIVGDNSIHWIVPE